VKSLLRRVEELEMQVTGHLTTSNSYISTDGVWQTEEDFSI
jgi:hypothetical protein